MHTEDTMVDKIDLVPAYGGLILVEKQINDRLSRRSKCCEVREQGPRKNRQGWLH